MVGILTDDVRSGKGKEKNIAFTEAAEKCGNSVNFLLEK